jgi:hypothetical protein
MARFGVSQDRYARGDRQGGRTRVPSGMAWVRRLMCTSSMAIAWRRRRRRRRHSADQWDQEREQGQFEPLVTEGSIVPRPNRKAPLVPVGALAPRPHCDALV